VIAARGVKCERRSAWRSSLVSSVPCGSDFSPSTSRAVSAVTAACSLIYHAGLTRSPYSRLLHLDVLSCYPSGVADDWFISCSQEIGWENHLRYDPFSVEWDVGPKLSHSTLTIGWFRCVSFSWVTTYQPRDWLEQLL